MFFDLFKRNKIASWEISLLKIIFTQIPNGKYKSYLRQIDEGLLYGVFFDDTVEMNYVGFTYRPGLSNHYENKLGQAIVIRNITAKDMKDGLGLTIKVFCVFDLIAGYSTSKKKFEIDLNSVDASQSIIEYEDYDIDTSFFSAEELKRLNSSDVYPIELAGETIYHLYDLEDGDFIGVNNQKEVYKVTHDPFLIKKMNVDLLSLLKQRKINNV